jgi:hypothetical protein
MQGDRDQQTGQESGLQFSLATLLTLVTVAALVAASITEVPEWIGAPLLAVLSTMAAAAVVAAAIRSQGYALTFYVGAAFPLCMFVLRTTRILSALSDGVMQRGASIAYGGGWMQLYEENFVAQRQTYRWEAAAALVSAPLIGLACVALRWLGDHQRQGAMASHRLLNRRSWMIPLLVCLLVLTTALFALVAVRSVRMKLPPDPAWEAHKGTPVQASGKTVAVPIELSAGDRVLVEQGSAWWRGRVKQVTTDGNVAIRYIGWDSTWDEVVPASRLQLP